MYIPLNLEPDCRFITSSLKYSCFIHFQVKAMIDILKIYNWRYVAFINSDDTYGKSAQQEFRQSAPLDNICLAFARTISQSADDMAFRDVIDELLDMQRESQVTSVILFMQVEMARKIFETATDVGAIRRFIWIGSDGWGNYDLQPVKGFEEAALGKFNNSVLICIKQ